MFTVKPIAYTANNRHAIEDDYWGNVVSTITLTDEFSEEALLGIEEFSHIEILFYFDKVEDHQIQYTARHPRNNSNYPKVGIFAQRGKNRPNRIGLTTVKLMKREGKTLFVEGLDAIHETPVLDIKPVLTEFRIKGETRQPDWATDLMKNYWV